MTLRITNSLQMWFRYVSSCQNIHARLTVMLLTPLPRCDVSSYCAPHPGLHQACCDKSDRTAGMYMHRSLHPFLACEVPAQAHAVMLCCAPLLCWSRASLGKVRVTQAHAGRDVLLSQAFDAFLDRLVADDATAMVCLPAPCPHPRSCNVETQP
jgi:hypothetical protein